MLRIEDLGEGIRLIGLDRAAKRNAIGVEMTLAIEDILLKTRDDVAVRVLVFHGIGGHFCAGMDMKDFFDSSTRPADELGRARAATEHWRTRLLYEMPQTLVTAVQGSCFGAALPLLAAAEVVVAGADARFGLPEINFGFVPGAQILKAASLRMAPRALALAALSGRPFDAQCAKGWGLVDEVVQGDPLPQALAIARRLADTAAAATKMPAAPTRHA